MVKVTPSGSMVKVTPKTAGAQHVKKPDQGASKPKPPGDQDVICIDID